MSHTTYADAFRGDLAMVLRALWTSARVSLSCPSHWPDKDVMSFAWIQTPSSYGT